jgi:hypothetical protein
MMTHLKPKTVFRAWKQWAMNEKAHREKTRWRTAKQDAEKLKSEHKLVIDAVRDLDGKVRKLKAHNDKVRIELMRQLEILHQPARQKKILKKIVTSLSSATTILEKEVRKETKDGFDDVYGGGQHNLRLAPLYTFDGKTGVPNAFMDFDEEDPWDEKVEQKILAWRPGNFKSKEFTHCFDLLKTRAGRVVKRFANYCISHHDRVFLAELPSAAGSAANSRPGSPRITPGTTPGSTPGASKRELGAPAAAAAAAALTAAPGRRTPGAPGAAAPAPARRRSFAGGRAPTGRLAFSSFKDMEDCHNYVKILDYISAASNGYEPRVQDSGQDVRGLPKR